MRVLILFLFWSAACGDPTPGEELADLEASSHADCGGYSTTDNSCESEVDAQHAAQCMTDALASGGRATVQVGGCAN
jgi:hypothetical protein